MEVSYSKGAVMPTVYDDWIAMNPKVSDCPICQSSDVSVETEAEITTSYVCNNCRHRWEEYN